MNHDGYTFAEALAQIPAKYASPDPKTLSKLPKPTKRENQKGKCDVCGGWHGLPAVHLDYMGHADVTLALLDIDPLWSWEPVAFDPNTGGPIIGQQGNRLVMWARLTVLGKPMLGVGTCESGKPDPEKELIGDFLRNAAMRFGVATNLWSKADSADPAGSGASGGYGQKSAPQERGPSRPAARAAAPAAAPRPAEPGQRGTVSDAQIKAMGAAFTGAGIRDRDARIGIISQVVLRSVSSSQELSKEEAGKVIDYVSNMSTHNDGAPS